MSIGINKKVNTPGSNQMERLRRNTPKYASAYSLPPRAFSCVTTTQALRSGSQCGRLVPCGHPGSPTPSLLQGRGCWLFSAPHPFLALGSLATGEAACVGAPPGGLDGKTRRGRPPILYLLVGPFPQPPTKLGGCKLLTHSNYF